MSDMEIFALLVVIFTIEVLIMYFGLQHKNKRGKNGPNVHI